MTNSSVANLLSTVFANDVSLSAEGIARYLSGPSMQAGAPLGDKVRRELVQLYKDPATDWLALLNNEVYEVGAAESPDEARSFVTEHIWNALFPEARDNPPLPG